MTEGVDGVLVSGEDPEVWAAVIAALALDPDRVARLRAGVRPPRTMDDVAGEMARLYESMLFDECR